MAGVGGVIRPSKKKPRAPVTKVVSLKKKSLNEQGYKDLLDWLKNPDHVYIGRDMTHYVPGAVESKWHNPFTEDNCPNLDDRIEKYREHIETDKTLHNGKTLNESLGELEGKTLGCWCSPNPCHGDVLKQLLKSRTPQK